jgi:iron(III) transport system permease protein
MTTSTVDRPAPAPAPVRGGRARRWLTGRSLFFLAIVLVVGYLTLGPIGYLLYGTFVGENGFTLRYFADAYGATGFGTSLVNTVVFAVGAALLAVVVGATLAFLVARTDTPLKSLVVAMSLVPLIIPGMLHTVAWILLASPQIGVVNQTFGLGFDIYTLPGMIFVQGLHTAPLVFLLMFPAFRSMDPSLEEAAFASGARLPTVLRRVTLPLAKPAIYASLLIAVVTGLEAFEVPVLLGGANGIDVITSHIWFALNGYPTRFGEAGAYSVGLLLVTAVGIYCYSRLQRRGKRFQTVTGKGFRPRIIQLGGYRWVGAGVVLAYFLVAVVLPLGVLVYASLQKVYAPPSWEALGNASLGNYADVLSRPSVTRAIQNSALLGVGAATVVMLVMAVAAWLVIRSRVRGAWLIDVLSSAPIAVPSLVLGVALIFTYLQSPLPVYGTLWILFIAYLTRYLPYGIRYASSAMQQIGGELEEAGEIAGATWRKNFRRIVLPLLLPGLIGGWIYIFIVSLRELASSLLLYSPGSEVLSVVIWEQWQNGSLGGLAAIGTLLVVSQVVLVSIMLAVTRKSGRGMLTEQV